MNIYVGNIPLNASVAQIKDMFQEFGAVKSVQIIMDVDSGHSKGFGFVEMREIEDGAKAIERLNNMNFMSNYLEVYEVRKRHELK